MNRYFSRALTASLTSLPSTLAPASVAIAAFMTLPKSFALVAPVSAMAAVTASAIVSGLAAGGINDVHWKTGIHPIQKFVRGRSLSEHHLIPEPNDEFRRARDRIQDRLGHPMT